MLAGLGHRTVGSRHHQNRTVHLRSTRDHVLHIVGMTRAIHVSVVTILRLVLHVSRRDRDATLTLFRSLVDLIEGHGIATACLRQNRGDRGGQRRLAMVYMTDRSNVYVRLSALELFLGHRSFPLSVLLLSDLRL